MKNVFLNCLKQLVILILIGTLSGLIVGLYQLGIQNIVKISTFMYSSKEPFIIVILIFLVGFCTVFNNFIILKDKNIDGSGIPSMKLARRKKLPISYLKDIPYQILNSYASTFTGFTLGSEGPSVVLASKISYGVNKIFKNKNETYDELAEGVGFGSAFLSPLAGFCYSIEESLESKLTLNKIISAVIMIISAYFITTLINQNHLLNLVSFSQISLNDCYIFPFLLIINLVVSVFFIKLMLFLRAFFIKHNDNKLVKFRSFPLFLLTFILNLFLLSFMQSGGKLIGNVNDYTSLVLLFSILLLRFMLTAISGSGDVTGGLVIPIMALGAINGQIASVISTSLFGLEPSLYPLINLISALMLFSFTIQTPFTSIALLFSTIIYTTNSLYDSLSALPLFTLTLLLGYLIMTRFFKVKSLYEGMIDVTNKYNKSENH